MVENGQGLVKPKILVLTQKVDLDDDLLGFFHGWLEKLATKAEKLTVVALSVGRYDLPASVAVYSLGKEKMKKMPRWLRRILTTVNLFGYIWRYRKDYDSVFVHMNVEYVILASWLWRLMDKKIVLWYAHYLIDWRAKLAFWWADKIVTSTAKACRISSSKLKVVGQGIDIDKFKAESQKPKVDDKFHILFLSRVSRIKKLDLLLKAFSQLTDKYPNLFLDIVGAPTPADGKYQQEVGDLIRELGIGDKIKSWGAVPNFKTVDFYNQADLYINLTPTGSFDKTSLEAMACEAPTLVCNRAFDEYFDEALKKEMIFEEDDEKDLVEKIGHFIDQPIDKKRAIGSQQRLIVEKYHSLDRLINNLINEF